MDDVRNLIFRPLYLRARLAHQTMHSAWIVIEVETDRAGGSLVVPRGRAGEVIGLINAAADLQAACRAAAELLRADHPSAGNLATKPGRILAQLEAALAQSDARATDHGPLTTDKFPQ